MRGLSDFLAWMKYQNTKKPWNESGVSVSDLGILVMSQQKFLFAMLHLSRPYNHPVTKVKVIQILTDAH